MDIQVHNLSWYVQEAQTARIAVHMLNESQAWFQDYLVELSSKRHNDDSNYWGESSDEEEAEAESHAKQRYDEVFAYYYITTNFYTYYCATTRRQAELPRGVCAR
jgi:hypothetical protein